MLTEEELVAIETRITSDPIEHVSDGNWRYVAVDPAVPVLVDALRSAQEEKRYWLEHYALDINGYLHCRWCGRQYSAFGHTEECPAGRLEEETQAALAAPDASGQQEER